LSGPAKPESKVNAAEPHGRLLLRLVLRPIIEGLDFTPPLAPFYAGRVAEVGSFLDSVSGVAAHPADELLHPLSDHDDDPHAVETLSFGFSVGERDLNCSIDHSLHPVHGLVSGGVVLTRGVVHNAAFADYIDYRIPMPMPNGDLDDVLYPSGVRVSVVEPLQRIELSYAGQNERVRFELVQEAVMPAVSPAEGGHFVQAMHTKGELVLDGEQIAIDGYFTRHRSWSVARAEGNEPTPPLGRVSAVFGPDLALHFLAHDGTGLSSKNLKWGYVWRDGEPRPINAVWMRTGRGEDGAAPIGVEARLLDANGETYELAGETCARAPLSVWPELIDQRCLMKYRMHGRQCYGDFQDIQRNSFLRSVRLPAGSG
jgi:hypothetical protein